MELAPDLVIPRIRCAPFHGSLMVDPVGSTSSYDAYLCVEVPLPWPRKVLAAEPFASLATAPALPITGADGRAWRPLALAPTPADEGWTRVIAYERPRGDAGSLGDAGAAVPFTRREWWVPEGQVLDLGQALVGADAEGVAAFDEWAVEVAADVVDLLVCTHGNHDACCGSLGAALHQEVAAALEGDEGVRVFRCSHLGGHRFAPTAMTFPDAYGWAHLTAELATRLARREGAPAEFAPHCRGTALVAGGPAQAADREALVQAGWGWMAASRSVTVVGFERDTMATTVEVRGEPAGGPPVALQVRVELERHVPQPTCGAIDGPEYAVEPVWRVGSVTALPA